MWTTRPTQPGPLLRRHCAISYGYSVVNRVTVFGEVTLTDGVDELIRGEQAFEGMSDSSSEP